MDYACFEEFVKAMVSIHGSMDGVSFNPSDFPPLSAKSSVAGLNSSSSPSSAANLRPDVVPTTGSTTKGALHADLMVSFYVADVQLSWSSLFPTDKAAQLYFHQPLVANGKPSVFILKSVYHKGFSVWEDCLVGQFFGAPPFSQIQSVARQLWGRRDRLDILRLHCGFFLFKFENPQTRSWVLDGGPWFVAQCPLLLKK